MNFQNTNSHYEEESSESSQSELSQQTDKNVKMVSISQDILIEILEENKYLKAKVAKLEKTLKKINQPKPISVTD